MTEVIELSGPILSSVGWQPGPAWVVNGVLTCKPVSAQITRTITGWVTPGLCDVHAHIGIDNDGSYGGDQAMLGQAKAHLQAGVLLVRDAGCPVDNSQIQRQSQLPQLLRSGRHLARKKRYIRGLGLEVEPRDLPDVVAKEAQRSDGWVKLVGDWIDRSKGADSDLDPLWDRAELTDAMAGAHESGARVTVHVFGHKAIEDLIEAGVDCIEHGSGIDRDQAQECASRGIAVTPTLLQRGLFDEFSEQAGSKYPQYAHTMALLAQNNEKQAQMLYEQGVLLLPGTDAGGYQVHGDVPKELAYWEKIGIPASEILDFATWKCRDYLGVDSLAENELFDGVIYKYDPSQNIATNLDPQQITATFRHGQLIQNLGS